MYLVLGSNKYDCQSQWRKRDGAHPKKKRWSSQISWKIFHGLYDDYNKDADIEAKWILQKLESAFNWTKMKVN